MSHLHEMLKRIGKMGSPCERFIAEFGTAYTFSPLRKPYRIGQPKQCFMNASQLAISHVELTYVEGYATSELIVGIPTLHAWCIDARGRVVDPTWDEDSSTYLGVPVSTELLMTEMERTGHYGVLFERGARFNETFVRLWKKERVEA